jgi:hypothetical protein
MTSFLNNELTLLTAGSLSFSPKGMRSSCSSCSPDAAASVAAAAAVVAVAAVVAAAPCVDVSGRILQGIPLSWIKYY